LAAVGRWFLPLGAVVLGVIRLVSMG